MTESWKQLLCCLHCETPLVPDRSGFICNSCGTAYEGTPSGTPVILSAEDQLQFDAVLARESGRQMKEQYARRTFNGRSQKLIRSLYPPDPVYVNPGAPPLPQPGGPLSLWLGGAGLQLPGFVNVDVLPVNGVDLVANAARLPFPAGCSDSIACLALLEHVPDAGQVVSEMFRVLRPGGWMQAVVPFCHPYHGYPADYARFSREGLEKLFAAYENVEIGIRTGPTTTMLTFLVYYLKLIFPVHGGAPARRAFNRLIVGGMGWLMAPLKYADIWLNRSPQAHVLANHFYVTARKPRDT